MPDASPWLERAVALAPLVESCADESERARRLSPTVVDAFHDAGLFRVQIPERFGGAGLDVIEALPIYEEIAAADGAAGWNLALGAGGGSFAAMLDDADVLERIVGAPRTLIAGSVNPMALRVVPEGDGYRVSGRLRYASGVSQSNWLMAGGLVFDRGSASRASRPTACPRSSARSFRRARRACSTPGTSTASPAPAATTSR
jgi:alkylation response protein AidB-like acyl-CoA dehydrogenase